MLICLFSVSCWLMYLTIPTPTDLKAAQALINAPLEFRVVRGAESKFKHDRYSTFRPMYKSG